jgi:hypothetical protein
MVEQEMLKPNADISKIDVIFFIVKLLNIYRVKGENNKWINAIL